MKKKLVGIIIILSAIFLNACTNTEVGTGTFKNNAEVIAQYVAEIYSEEDIVLENKDYGGNIGILPTYLIQDDYKILGAIRLTNERQVESIFFENLSEKQVKTILSDLGIEGTFYFDQVLNYDDNKHKTRYQNMILELNNDPIVSELNPEIGNTLSNDIDQDGNFYLNLSFDQVEEVEETNSFFSIDNISNLLGIIVIFIGAYYTVVDSIASSILFLRPKPDDLFRLNYDLSSVEEKRKYNKDIFYLVLIIIAVAIFLSVLVKGTKGVLIAIFCIVLFILYVSYCEYKRKKNILTIKVFDKVNNEKSHKNYESWYFLFQTEQGFVFSKEKYREDIKDNLKELIFLKEDEVLKYFSEYDYHGPDNFIKYLFRKVILSIYRVIKGICRGISTGLYKCTFKILRGIYRMVRSIYKIIRNIFRKIKEGVYNFFHKT